MPEPSGEFQKVRYHLVSMSDRDREYVRRWVLRWIAEDGKLLAPRSAFLYGGGAHFKRPDQDSV